MSFIDDLISDLVANAGDKPIHVTVGCGTVGYHVCLRPFSVREGVLAGPVIPPPDPVSPASALANATPIPGDAKIIPISEQVTSTPAPVPEATSLWSTEAIPEAVTVAPDSALSPPEPVLTETTSGAPLVSG